MIRIIVVDDHQLVRTGTRRLLEDVPGLKVIADAGSGEEAVELVRELKPDVVLMDIQMPGIGGLEATRRCLRAHPEVKVLVVTIYEDEPYPSKLLNVGASGYLTKGADIKEMLLAIRKVHAGHRTSAPKSPNNARFGLSLKRTHPRLINSARVKCRLP